MTLYEQMIAAIDAYQKRTGVADWSLSKRLGQDPTFVFRLRRGRLKEPLDKADAVIKFCTRDD